jgi:hypothetical protein
MVNVLQRTTKKILKLKMGNAEKPNGLNRLSNKFASKVAEATPVRF